MTKRNLPLSIVGADINSSLPNFVSFSKVLKVRAALVENRSGESGESGEVLVKVGPILTWRHTRDRSSATTKR